MESLAEQKDCGFPWELIVCEETPSEFEPFGEKAIFAYADALKKLGCKEIKYIGIKERVPLSVKWGLIADEVSNTDVFLLQAADCFSQPWRLAQSLHFIENNDWVASPWGAFYSIATEQVILYDQSSIERPYPTGLSMGIRTELVKDLPSDEIKKGIDGWLFHNAGRTNGGKLKVAWNTTISYQYGLDTHGKNCISHNRDKHFASPSPPFTTCNFNIYKRIPAHIMLRLQRLKTDMLDSECA